MPLGMELGLGLDDFVLDGDPAPLPAKSGGTAPIFGPCLLWPDDWMGQYVTWYGHRHRIRRYCVRLGPSSPKKGAQPQFSAHVYCGQTAGWIKMPLGREVGISLSVIVLDGDLATPLP